MSGKRLLAVDEAEAVCLMTAAEFIIAHGGNEAFAERLRALARQYPDSIDADGVPRRGHYADLEVVAAILRSDPRERASGYDANPQSMAEAVENIVETFGPA